MPGQRPRTAVSNSRCNLDHFGTNSPASAFERLSASAGRPARNGEAQSRGVGNAMSRLLLLPLYRLYEIRLRSQVCAQPAPRHVGIILDGNRRYARRCGAADLHQIYALGARKLDDVLEWCGELSIPAVTLWAISTDNLSRRSAAEVSSILAAVEAKVAALARDPRIHQRRVVCEASGAIPIPPPPSPPGTTPPARANAAVQQCFSPTP